MHIRDYLAALKLVNEERGKMNLPPLERLPEGTPSDSVRCAIAMGIPGATVTGIVITPQGRQRASPEVRSFIRAFDAAGRRGVETPVDPCALVEGGVDDDKGCLVEV